MQNLGNIRVLNFARRQGYFSPRQLFRNNVNGVWYDPSDLSTMFQDSAGTTPVTAVGQPVGKILDKSGRGNHAIQATSASRPVLSAKVNLLTYTEDFSNAAWGASWSFVIDKTSILSPIGTQTGNKITGTAVAAVLTSNFTAAVTAYTYSIYVKAGSVSSRINFRNATTSTDLINVNYNSAAGSYSNSYGTWTVEDVAYGWKRLTINITSGVTVGNNMYVYVVGSILANGEYVYAWGADLRTTTSGVNLPLYQRVGAATDYDTTGFPYYLSFDGVDDFLVTAATLNMTATDEITHITGAYANVLAPRGLFFESANNSVQLNVGLDAGAFTAISGPIAQKAIATVNANTPYVISGISKISAPFVSIRRNGSLIQTNNSSQGTGTYDNRVWNIGARNGASVFLSGRIYQLIIANKNYLDNIIKQTEKWVNLKTKAY